MFFRFTQLDKIRDHVITLIILIMAVIMMVNRHDGGLHNIRKISIALVSYMEAPLSNVRIYRSALQTNTKLQQENVLLLDELSRLRSAQEQNEILKDLLGINEKYEYDLQPVLIVSKNLTGINNSITINAGSDSGVQVGMAVVNADGLVGQVIITGERYSQVLPLYNRLFRVSVNIQGSRAYGVVSWSGENLGELIVNFVPKTIPVEPGMIVETSGLSSQFPANIPVGRVLRSLPESGKDTQQIFLEPFVSLHEIAEAFVLMYEPDPELPELERQFREIFE
jgi:rod shape-determining protein MreC